jgi:hypothetical protein
MDAPKRPIVTFIYRSTAALLTSTAAQLRIMLHESHGDPSFERVSFGQQVNGDDHNEDERPQQHHGTGVWMIWSFAVYPLGFFDFDCGVVDKPR